MGSFNGKIKKNFNLVDLFCGAGGLTLGFKQTKRFNAVFANDIDKDMCSAYSFNFPETEISSETISNVNFHEIAEKQNIDVVIGGPPCQAYSTSGKRSNNDNRSKLFIEYFNSIKSLNPKIFLYENVKGLISFRKGLIFKEIKELFSSIDYDLSFHLINAADYGVPQIRERVFLFGIRKGINYFFPKKTHTNQLNAKYITIDDALSDMTGLA